MCDLNSNREALPGWPSRGGGCVDKRGGGRGHEGDDGTEGGREEGRQQRHQGARGDEGAGERSGEKAWKIQEIGWHHQISRHKSPSVLTRIEMKAN